MHIQFCHTGKYGASGESCTHDLDVGNVALSLLSYTRMASPVGAAPTSPASKASASAVKLRANKLGRPGRTRTFNLSGQSRVLPLIELPACGSGAENRTQMTRLTAAHSTIELRLKNPKPPIFTGGLRFYQTCLRFTYEYPPAVVPLDWRIALYGGRSRNRLYACI